MNPKDYTNHSGGAKGADLAWDKIGKSYGFTKHIHWGIDDIKPDNISDKDRREMLADVDAAAKALCRPTGFKGIELVQRNWLQVHHSDAIYAIALIIEPGTFDFKGFANNTGKPIVAGGTGWAVEMAIQKVKPVFVFDMDDDNWYLWHYDLKDFVPCDVPKLAFRYAGIGSRDLSTEGEKAIRAVYERALTGK